MSVPLKRTAVAKGVGGGGGGWGAGFEARRSLTA